MLNLTIRDFAEKREKPVHFGRLPKGSLPFSVDWFKLVDPVARLMADTNLTKNCSRCRNLGYTRNDKGRTICSCFAGACMRWVIAEIKRVRKDSKLMGCDPELGRPSNAGEAPEGAG